MADACAAAGLDVPVLDEETRAAIDVHMPSYGTSQNPVDSTAQGVHKLGYAEFARLVAQSPLDRWRHRGGDCASLSLPRRRFAKAQGSRANSTKPVFMWTYTLPSDRSIEILNEAGYPLFTGAHGCARTMRAMADYRALRERPLQPQSTTSRITSGSRAKCRALLQRPVRCCANGRPDRCSRPTASELRMLAYLVQSPDEAAEAARAIGRRGRTQGPVGRHPAQNRSWRGRFEPWW